MKEGRNEKSISLVLSLQGSSMGLDKWSNGGRKEKTKRKKEGRQGAWIDGSHRSERKSWMSLCRASTTGIVAREGEEESSKESGKKKKRRTKSEEEVDKQERRRRKRK